MNGSFLHRITGSIMAIVFLFSSIFLITCKDDDDNDNLYPVIFTGPVTGVSSAGAVFQGLFNGRDISKIDDHGFVWDTKDNPELGSTNFKSLGSSAKEKFSAEISFALETNKTYYVRAFYKMGKTIFYGHSVSFASLGSKAPVITALEPEKASWGDTISVIGENFSFRIADLSVRFGPHTANLVSASDTFLRAVVPQQLDTIYSGVSVNLFGNQAFSVQKFSLLPPEIYNVSLVEAYFKSEIVITGKHFKKDYTRVYFDDKEATQIEINPDRIICRIPFYEKSTEVSLKVEVISQEDKFSQKIRVLVPEITRLSAYEGTWRDTITIYGENFPTITSDIKILFDNEPLGPLFGSRIALLLK